MKCWDPARGSAGGQFEDLRKSYTNSEGNSGQRSAHDRCGVAWLIQSPERRTG